MEQSSIDWYIKTQIEEFHFFPHVWIEIPFQTCGTQLPCSHLLTLRSMPFIVHWILGTCHTLSIESLTQTANPNMSIVKTLFLVTEGKQWEKKLHTVKFQGLCGSGHKRSKRTPVGMNLRSNPHNSISSQPTTNRYTRQIRCPSSQKPSRRDNIEPAKPATTR